MVLTIAVSVTAMCRVDENERSNLGTSIMDGAGFRFSTVMSF